MGEEVQRIRPTNDIQRGSDVVAHTPLVLRCLPGRGFRSTAPENFSPLLLLLLLLLFVSVMPSAASTSAGQLSRRPGESSRCFWHRSRRRARGREVGIRVVGMDGGEAGSAGRSRGRLREGLGLEEEASEQPRTAERLEVRIGCGKELPRDGLLRAVEELCLTEDQDTLHAGSQEALPPVLPCQDLTQDQCLVIRS